MGGVTSACTAVATACYGAATEQIVPVSSPEAAEMIKLFENTFRSVNIALANELLLMFDKLGLDASEIIDAAATKALWLHEVHAGVWSWRSLHSY